MEGSDPGRPGFFLVFEGVEGAGKTTHARWLGGRLTESGVPCRVVREPGETPAGERVREIVLDSSLEMTAEMELFLILAARAEFVRTVVKPALASGEVVVADRYEMSTFAYQGVARGLDLDEIQELNRFATGGVKPDAVILLTLDPAEGLRRKHRGLHEIEKLDRLELEGLEFLRQVAGAYVELAQQDPRVIEVNANSDPKDVHSRILDVLVERFPETFAPIPGLRN